MSVSINVHDTPRHVYDAINIPEQRAGETFIVRWKSVQTPDAVILFFPADTSAQTNG